MHGAYLECMLRRSFLPKKPEFGPPTTFGGGERIRLQESVSPGPNFAPPYVPTCRCVV